MATSLAGAEDVHDDSRRNSLIRRSWYAMSDLLSPFSPSALASLPTRTFRRRPRYTRADNVPEAAQDEHGQMPTVRDYHSINLPPQVRVPKKIATPIKVEGKVWFANERTWISYLQLSVLVGTLALALFNASKDQIARDFAYAYAAISVGVLIYGYALYQRRITLIRKRDPGHFDQILGPVLISVCLFSAVLANFVIRVRELQKKNIPIPGIPFLWFESMVSSTAILVFVILQ
ncbi:Vacuolar transporter chaperone 2 [Grifola frondosa]|uniref:Vacuolar transporter chaperone 2 n=1 Tax=Grifola frondosa TaxID=5627 RepID=A0A1C7M6H0_GRIFR|nr:Vacuolar transporter chaperone 2 [Grifola frondosa]